ncbi:MAG: DUF3108 domain-containing protein [Gammaproteobacteria bacterium]|nr:DUF3108 domain-containing protein [Gammaproteobacteria bacterium]MCK5263096.1 DUF3108 domain-containing protein [Gammaproteobacteria bacterium]
MAIQYTFPTSIKTTLPHLLKVLVLLPSLSFALPLEYTASYDVEKFGMIVAKSNYSLKHENNGLRITQHSEAVGFAALLRSDELDENSFLSIQNDQLLLTEFSYTQKSPDKKNRNIQLKIDWIQSDEKLLGKISGTAYGKKLELKVDKPVWDTSSYQVPLMLNTKEKASPQQYTMMVKGRFKTYSFITHGSEKIEVNGNTIQTIKTERDGGISKSPIYLWLAPSLNNLPVKVEKWKNGKLQLTLSLNQAQFPSDKSKEFKAVVDENEEFDE